MIMPGIGQALATIIYISGKNSTICTVNENISKSKIKFQVL